MDQVKPETVQPQMEERKIEEIRPKSSIYDLLTDFFKHRPTFSEVVNRGILKTQITFGSKFYDGIPQFVIKCIDHVESGDRLLTPGLYHIPASLPLVQKVAPCSRPAFIFKKKSAVCLPFFK